MNRKTVQTGPELDGAHVCLPIPVNDPDLFRHDATAQILRLVTDNPDRAFSNRQLHRLTGKGMGNVNGAVTALEDVGLITVDRGGRSNRIEINAAKLYKPDDRITLVPQTEFQRPIRAAMVRLGEAIGTDIGVVLFGSVARGSADRASDIDLFVVVPDDRMAGQRTAHEIEKEIGSERFDGDRYEFHIVVETRDSAPKHDRISDILTEGITLRTSAALDAVKGEVFENGA
ncbi:nucleotidyltransferase domain-containing protein [Halosolutus amylolyticus]|uniref:Nucleotidyltransferase domain-containing protein n=1 Tax=Halosolutus amylolyticus TaxID=2932267 RepID=A0ABD5PM02_9EURY|nr:nucleotidyltransferase domain-containing protein [Halosolutus amylolyticus]